MTGMGDERLKAETPIMDDFNRDEGDERDGWQG